MATPFIAHNCVIFECNSGRICVGDFVNDPASYAVKVHGLCHIPSSAIQRADKSDADAFAVDNAQIFLVDSIRYQEICDAVSARGDLAPDTEFLSDLRARFRTQFGFVVAGDLYDSEFDGDGTYRLEIGLVEEGVPKRDGSDDIDSKEMLRRIISSMNTLVCAKCFSTEIQQHPELGPSPTGRGKEKKHWCSEMADYAIEAGWTATNEPGSFVDITPICPNCRTELQM